MSPLILIPIVVLVGGLFLHLLVTTKPTITELARAMIWVGLLVLVLELTHASIGAVK